MASEDGDEAPLSDVKFRLIESEAAPGASNGIPSVLFDATAFGSRGSSFKNVTTVELYATAGTWVTGSEMSGDDATTLQYVAPMR